MDKQFPYIPTTKTKTNEIINNVMNWMQRFIILNKFLPGFQLITLLNQQRFYIVEKLSKTQMAQKAAMNLSFFSASEAKTETDGSDSKVYSHHSKHNFMEKKIVRSAHHLFIIPKKFRASWLAFETEIERRD